MTENTPRASLPARTANARREVTYWAGWGGRTALRAVCDRLENATFWSLCGSAFVGGGLIIWAFSCPAWNRSVHATSDAVWGGIFTLAGIVLLYFHGESKRRGGGNA